MHTLPSEILSYMLTYCGDANIQDLAVVSKRFSTAVDDIFRQLGQACFRTLVIAKDQSCTHLKNKEDSNSEVQACRHLFRKIIHKAYQLELLAPKIPIVMHLLTPARLDKIVYSIKALEALSLIDFSSSAFENTPSFPQSLSQIRGDALVDQAEEIRDWFNKNLPFLEGLTTLKMGGNRTFIGKALPTEIKLFKNLTTLEIATAHDMRGVPKEVGDLKELKIFKIAFTSITHLPEEIWSFRKLEQLTISHSPLTSISSKIKQLQNLKECEIEFTSITSFPEEIGSLSQLTTLSFDGNEKLISLPSSISALSLLIIFKLNECRALTSLPDEFKKMTNLQVLFILNTNATLTQAVLNLKANTPLPQLKVVVNAYPP